MQTLTQHDVLAPLFDLHPALVALVILVLGWVNLFLIAVKTNSLRSFLRHPGFTVGDLIMLPFAGFLITYFYQNAEGGLQNVFVSQGWMYAAVVLALALSVRNFYRSLFVQKRAPLHILILPHFFFYWFVVYILILFASKGLSYIIIVGGLMPVLLYLGVLLAVATHLAIPLIFKPKTFPRMRYQGVIIEESLRDTSVLRDVTVMHTKVEPVTEKHKTPWVQQWTLHTVEVSKSKVEEVADKIASSIDSRWYADFKDEESHYIILHNKVFKVSVHTSEYKEVVRYGVSLGIPRYQLDFSPDIEEWERE